MSALSAYDTHARCTQEPRLIHLENALAGISDTLKDVKDLLRSSIQADERIRTLQKEAVDREERLRKLESAVAASRWLERVVWTVVAAGIGLLFNFKGDKL